MFRWFYHTQIWWWFQMVFIFIPTWGKDPIWQAYFSDVLKVETTNKPDLMVFCLGHSSSGQELRYFLTVPKAQWPSVNGGWWKWSYVNVYNVQYIIYKYIICIYIYICMNVIVCKCVFMYICISTGVYIYVYVCVIICLYVEVFLFLCVYVYMSKCVCMFVPLCLHMPLYVSVSMWKYIIYIYVQAYMFQVPGPCV